MESQSTYQVKTSAKIFPLNLVHPSLALEVVEVEVFVVVTEEEEGRRERHAPHDGERVLQEQRGGLRGGERRGEVGAQGPYLEMAQVFVGTFSICYVG